MSRSLIKDSVIYGLGTALTRSMNFLLLPIYTRYLDVTEFGMLALLNLIMQNVGFICLLGISTAAMRFYYDEGADADHRSRVFGTATALLLILPAIVLLVLGPIIWFLATRFLTSVPFIPLIFVVLLTGLFTPMKMLAGGLLRVQRRPLAYIALSFGFLALQSTATLVALVGLEAGLTGQIYSQLVANALWLCIALGMLWQFSRPTLSRPLVLKMLRYSLPLIPFFIFLWLNEASGRFLLERFGDLRMVGVFALASQFAGIMLVFATSLDNSLLPHFIERASQPDGEAELGLLVTRYLWLFGLLGIAVIIGAPPVIRLMAGPSYQDAIVYVAPLVLACWLSAASQPFNWSLSFSRRTGSLSTLRGLSFGVLIGLLLLFLGPLNLGISGVILAMILANLFAVTTSFVSAQRGYRLQVPWARLLSIAMALLAGGLAATWLGSDALNLPRLGLQLGLFAALTLLTARLAGINKLTRLWRPFS